ncbi:hypothetical protein TNCV_2078021 [Trichonephila clavipes]|nr:hypothetical protein TNCV_2078021 [Trichonephila clavipes]
MISKAVAELGQRIRPITSSVHGKDMSLELPVAASYESLGFFGKFKSPRVRYVAYCSSFLVLCSLLCPPYFRGVCGTPKNPLKLLRTYYRHFGVSRSGGRNEKLQL